MPLPFLAGGAVGVPISVWALPHMNPAHVELALGTMLLACCPVMLSAPRLPPVTRGGRLGDAAAGAVGELMGGIGGFIGVVPALWCTLRGYDKDAHRAVLQNCNLAAPLNIGMIEGPIDSPPMADFAGKLERINAVAEASPGLVWRLQTEAGDATPIRPFDDNENMLVDVSVWRDVASLNTCVCGSVHVEPMRRKAFAAPGPVVAGMPGSFSAERPAT